MKPTKRQRQTELLAYIRKRSGRRFLVSVLAKEFNVTERTIQNDLAFFEIYGLIDRIPSCNKLGRQNGNILEYSGDRRRQSHPLDELYKNLEKQKLRGERKVAQKRQKRGTG